MNKIHDSEFYLRGHCEFPQVTFSVDGPRHGRPPPDGGGLVQVLVRNLVPPPQLWLQAVKEP